MRVRSVVPTCVAFIIGCASSGATPGNVGIPPTADVKASDAALLPITVAAAQRLRLIVPGQRVAFAVYINGQTVNPATDSVARLYSFSRIPLPSESKCVVMRATVTSTNTPVNVPANVGAILGPNAPPVCSLGGADANVTFTVVRTRNDSAFVGGQQVHLASSGFQTEAFCITLEHSAGAWVPTANGSVSRPESCPR